MALSFLRSNHRRPGPVNFFSKLVGIFLVCAAVEARAQLVADGDTNVLDGVTTNVTGFVTVGNSGPFTLLVLTNAALLTNSGSGIIGSSSTGNRNEVMVTGAGSGWDCAGSLTIGQSGNFNRLSIFNGGLVTNDTGILGGAGSNNSV